MKTIGICDRIGANAMSDRQHDVRGQAVIGEGQLDSHTAGRERELLAARARTMKNMHSAIVMARTPAAATCGGNVEWRRPRAEETDVVATASSAVQAARQCWLAGCGGGPLEDWTDAWRKRRTTLLK